MGGSKEKLTLDSNNYRYSGAMLKYMLEKALETFEKILFFLKNKRLSCLKNWKEELTIIEHMKRN